MLLSRRNINGLQNAGVDIEAGYESVELMKKFVKGTMRPEVLGGLGGFSGAFSLENIKKMEEPILYQVQMAAAQSETGFPYGQT